MGRAGVLTTGLQVPTLITVSFISRRVRPGCDLQWSNGEAGVKSASAADSQRDWTGSAPLAGDWRLPAESRWLRPSTSKEEVGARGAGPSREQADTCAR